MTDIKSLLPEELEQYILSLGEPKFRAKQLFRWLSTGAESFDAMQNLPKALREKLADACALTAPVLLKRQSSADGTVKCLWELADGNAVETVVMRYAHGNTVCISSQVGCRQGCAFCASTIGGLVRNLTAGEMLDEVLFSEKICEEAVSNVVLMGIGEPLDNYDNVVRFLRLISCPEGRNLGLRHISLSTCGVTERMAALAGEGLPVTLAVSLHAPDDETRSRLMPANRNTGVAALGDACVDYFRRTGRRVSFEYAMIDGVNDATWQARRLSELAKKCSAHINLIPLNKVEERQFQPSRPERMRAFCRILEDKGANFTIRRRLGGDIDAACGQLRRKAACKKKPGQDEKGNGGTE